MPLDGDRRFLATPARRTGAQPTGQPDIFVPDGRPLPDALGRVTDLGIVAHPDDLEFLAIGAIGECLDSTARWFGGVVVTDGAGSTQGESPGERLKPAALAEQRRDEQIEAARRGQYAFVTQLAHASSTVRAPGGNDELVDQLVEILRLVAPTNLYTHNLADKHATHVAVGAAVVKALRRLPMEDRPPRVVGVEGWRDLDWLPDHDKVRMDVTRFGDLARDLAGIFESQLDGGKRYDLAAEGRRRANATFFETRRPDRAEQVVVAMDLTPLARNDDVDPILYVRSAIERFRTEAEVALSRFFPR
ncbi:MAG: PIG-L family deacetylase [Actinobacteria bacterium]|nr:PIG-L family deacetylase [Actinomycetota bacterium]